MWCACTLTATSSTSSPSGYGDVLCYRFGQLLLACIHVCVYVCAQTDAAGRYTNPFALFQVKILCIRFSSPSPFIHYYLALRSFGVDGSYGHTAAFVCMLRPLLRLFCVHMKNAFDSSREWNRFVFFVSYFYFVPLKFLP